MFAPFMEWLCYLIWSAHWRARHSGSNWLCMVVTSMMMWWGARVRCRRLFARRKDHTRSLMNLLDNMQHSKKMCALPQGLLWEIITVSVLASVPTHDWNHQACCCIRSRGKFPTTLSICGKVPSNIQRKWLPQLPPLWVMLSWVN